MTMIGAGDLWVLAGRIHQMAQAFDGMDDGPGAMCSLDRDTPDVLHKASAALLAYAKLMEEK